MISEERRARLMRLINENGYVQVTDLVAEFEVSSVTIRRDLEIMENEGLLIRKRGGAIRRNQGVTMELPYIIKQVQNVDIKKRIAETALNMIADGDSIILDSGSTTFELAQQLFTKTRISVVTNDLYIATKLAANPDIDLICTGGVARSNVFSLQGAIAESCIRNLRVEITFLGADAIHPDGGIYNVNINEVPVKHAMIESAPKVVLLADSSKFEVCGFAKICTLSQIDTVITDDGITEETTEMILNHPGCDLIIV
jgi:DeoR/GlpR family transcriptional regulator of sugar metabolism